VGEETVISSYGYATVTVFKKKQYNNYEIEIIIGIKL